MGQKNVVVKEVVLESGDRLPEVKVSMEWVGTLSPAKDNVILNCHALTGDIFAYGDSRQVGWWHGMIGHNQYLDLEKYVVITMNVLGGCYGTTGPSSINPKTGKPYGGQFPTVTIRDMVELQRKCLLQLGIQQVAAVVGGSMGGMVALEWAVRYPDFMKHCILIATAPYLTPLSIGYNEIAKQAIINDPNYQAGNYYEGTAPEQGLAIARMIGMVTYKTEDLFRERFLKQADNDVKSYLSYQGGKLVSRFDANTYLLFLQAMNLYDLGKDWGSLKQAYQRIKADLLIIGIKEDLYFPIWQQREMYSLCRQIGKAAELFEISSEHGHDAFLVPALYPQFGSQIQSFLEHHVSTSLTLPT